MGVFASVQANFSDSHQHLSKAVWLSRSPKLHLGISKVSLLPLWTQANSSVFSLFLGQVKKKRLPLPLIPKVKIKCNNTLQSAWKGMNCVLSLPGRCNCHISPGNPSPQVCLGPWTQTRFAEQGSWSIHSPQPLPPLAFLSMWEKKKRMYENYEPAHWYLVIKKRSCCFNCGGYLLVV